MFKKQKINDFFKFKFLSNLFCNNCETTENFKYRTEWARAINFDRNIYLLHTICLILKMSQMGS